MTFIIESRISNNSSVMILARTVINPPNSLESETGNARSVSNLACIYNKYIKPGSMMLFMSFFFLCSFGWYLHKNAYRPIMPPPLCLSQE